MRLNAGKCHFFMSEVNYFAHILIGKGIKPVQDKIEAIRHAPIPSNTSELKSFLGMINYYGNFRPQFSFQISSVVRFA